MNIQRVVMFCGLLMLSAVSYGETPPWKGIYTVTSNPSEECVYIRNVTNLNLTANPKEKSATGEINVTIVITEPTTSSGHIIFDRCIYWWAPTYDCEFVFNVGNDKKLTIQAYSSGSYKCTHSPSPISGQNFWIKVSK